MSNPIRGHKRAFAIPVEAKIHNRFDLEVIDITTGEVRQRAQAENVICNQLWSRLIGTNSISNSSYFNYIHYGTGSGTPSASDTSLFTFSAALQCTDEVITTNFKNGVYSLRQKIQITDTMENGQTITEVGIAYDATSTHLCTHAMLKDMNGNQISIAKTATDIINVYATVFVHIPSGLLSTASPVQVVADSPMMKFLAGKGTYYFGPPSYMLMYAGRQLIFGGSTNNTYPLLYGEYKVDLANKKITIPITRCAAEKGNIPKGVSWIILYNYYDNTYNFRSYPAILLKPGMSDSWFSGTDITGEAVGTGDGSVVDFATAFDTPQNAKVYVNGVVDTTATVDAVPLSYQNMSRYFEGIKVEDGIIYPYCYEGRGYYDGIISLGTYYNPHWAYGIKSFNRYSDGVTVSVSNNAVDWTVIDTGSGSGTFNVPEAYQNYKYWRLAGASSTYTLNDFYAKALTGKNIHFTTAPASGAVITADYHTPVIAKDVNHVFDLTVTIQLGEYTAT